jgi:hypothetical protein
MDMRGDDVLDVGDDESVLQFIPVVAEVENGLPLGQGGHRWNFLVAGEMGDEIAIVVGCGRLDS